MQTILLLALLGAPKVVDAPAPPAAIRPAGKIERSVRFTDAGGDKWVVLSRKDEGQSTFLYAVYATRTKAGWKRLRTVKDWVKGCEFDIVASFRKGAFGVTDVDGDGHAEVSFAYELDCTSDVSPNSMKLMLLEGEAKYAVRGTSRVTVGPDMEAGGEAKLDPSLSGQPKLRARAEALWNRLIQ